MDVCLTRGGCVIGQVAAPDDVVKNRAATKRGRHLNAHIARERLGVRASLRRNVAAVCRSECGKVIGT